MPPQDNTAALREHLAGPPNGRTFQGIKDLISEASGPELAQLLAYAEAHLETWEDAQRSAKLMEVWPTFPEGEPSPAIQLAKKLVIWGDVSFHGAATPEDLFCSPHIAHITGLELQSINIDRDAAKVMASSPQLAQLKTLRMDKNNLGAPGIRALVKSKHLTQLEELEITNNDIKDTGAELLAAWPQLGQLKKLSLQGNKIGATGALQLVTSPQLTGLTYLNLNQNAVDASGAQAIAEAGTHPGLELFMLNGNPLKNEGKRALARGRALPEQIRRFGYGSYKRQELLEEAREHDPDIPEKTGKSALIDLLVSIT